MPTGAFFSTQSVESLVTAVEEFERRRDAFVPRWCRKQAMKFSVERFRSSFARLLERELDAAGKRRFPKANGGQAGARADETLASAATGFGR
jgi:hypothetical protein